MWRVVVDTLLGEPYVYELDEPTLVHTNQLVSLALKAHSMNVAVAGAPLAVEVVEMSYKAEPLPEMTYRTLEKGSDESGQND